MRDSRCQRVAAYRARSCAVVAATASLLAPASALCAVRGDFDGDGHADLAVGAPQDSVSGLNWAGAVNVIYGSARGLHAAGNQEWTQDAPGVPGGAGEGDRFGGALAAGDFDGDGGADLAIGSPGEGISAIAGGVRANRMLAGTVTVLYGRRSGLSAHGAQRWSEDTPGIQGRAESGDTFGQALAAGDFDGDTGASAVAISCGARKRSGSRARRSAATRSAARSRSATSTVTARETWPSASRSRVSARRAPPAPACARRGTSCGRARRPGSRIARPPAIASAARSRPVTSTWTGATSWLSGSRSMTLLSGLTRVP